MLKTKCLLVTIIISIIVLFNICTTCYAAIPVTEENLKQAFAELEKFSEEEIKFSVNNDIISVTADNEKHSMDYDLTEHPTFLIEISEEEIGGLKTRLGDLAYIAVAYTQGVDIEDAAEYILEPLIISVNSPMYEKMEKIRKEIRNITEVDPNTIIMTDSNTYTWTMKTTENAIVNKLTVHLDGNFNKVEEYAELIRERYNSSENQNGNSSGNKTDIDNGTLGATGKEENIVTPEQQKRETEEALLREMEKQYKTEKNKISNEGDTTMLVLKTITVVSIIALVVVMVCSKKMKK